MECTRIDKSELDDLLVIKKDISTTRRSKVSEVELLPKGREIFKIDRSRYRSAERYVIKTVEITDDDRNYVIAEVKILKRLKLPFIPRFYGCLEVDDQVHILMEHVGFGESFEKVQSKYKREDMRLFLTKLYYVIKVLHLNGIFHRNILLNNILMNGSDIKLTGLAFICDYDKDTRQTYCSNNISTLTPQEMIKKDWDSYVQIAQQLSYDDLGDSVFKYRGNPSFANFVNVFKKVKTDDFMAEKRITAQYIPFEINNQDLNRQLKLLYPNTYGTKVTPRSEYSPVQDLAEDVELMRLNAI
jgi:serine/threonine protein kinase